MKQYLNLLQDVLDNGVWKDPARPGMPRTKEVFGRMLKFDMSKGFPLLTTKKMAIKSIITELLWFLKGDTNIRYLNENGCKIWNDDAYRYYCTLAKEIGKSPVTKDEFLAQVMTPVAKHVIEHPFPNELPDYKYGDCARIYGHQWRSWNGWFDQINYVINSITERPNSRYHVVTAWNPADFANTVPGTRNLAALPACHMLMQFCVQGDKLHLSMTQRSADIFLGLPFNIASYALLLHIVARATNLTPGEFTWFGNSVHIYENHINQAYEQLEREPFPLPELHIHEGVTEYTPESFEIINYDHHDAIKAPLSVGI